MATSFISKLTAGEPYVLLFAGQASPWRETLAEILEDPALTEQITQLIAQSDKLLAPVAAQLAAVFPGALTIDNLSDSNDPAHSVPGIVATQVALLQGLADAGLDITEHPPVAAIGHSQGELAAAVARAWQAGNREDIARIFAIARLIGAAGSRECRTLGLSNAKRTPMLAVANVDPAQVEAALEGTDAAISLTNSHRRVIVSGTPADLERVERHLEEAADADKAELASKTRGGAPFNPTTYYLQAEAPFHHPSMQPAVDQVVAWAERCNIEGAEELAAIVLTDPMNWIERTQNVIKQGAEWVLDLGPGDQAGKLTAEVLDGTGVGIAPAHSLRDIYALAAPNPEPARLTDWSKFAPRLLNLPGGTFVETKFTRLTGHSPILLAGMTPTTVDPEIVAAASNAGYWAELAGGGQVTAPVFAKNLASLKEQLEPGRSAQFNAMFMDRYLWNLQFGAQRIVSKARMSGAPLDGVVISAGIPEQDEAPELIAELNGQGFSNIAFKPGTVAQIRQVLNIARAVDATIILHVEDGHAGGHHSWENLDDLLRNTYAEIRSTDNVVLCVGGGIGTPDRAADYISGQWSEQYGLPPMPVDGVLIGTAAMTAKEAKTTDTVKELLVSCEGIDPADHGGWVGAGKSKGGITSGLSHLRADMYEIDNDAAACARLVAEVEGKPELLRSRRAEIIEALNKTAKPYFGDLEEMTYAEVARRFADLSFPWVDPSWSQRFWELLQRFEARLSDAEYGPVETLFPELDDVVEDPHAAADQLIAAYPVAEQDTLTPLDSAWFVALCRKYPKPMGFVPAIDDDLLRWWGQDSLWQAQDERYDANSVRVIPGPVSVRGITSVDEPIADILGRFETECVERLNDAGADKVDAYARLGSATDAAALVVAAPFISWTGHLMDNPAHNLPADQYTLEIDDAEEGKAAAATLTIKLDTYWDDSPASVHAVRELVIPLLLPTSVQNGGLPIVDEDRLPKSMFDLLAGTAGVGNVAVQGDEITGLPTMADSERSEYGEARYSFTFADSLGSDHTAVTGAALPGADVTTIVPDALLGTCWPAIYAALGSAMVNDYPVIEGLLNAVHLDHTVRFIKPVAELKAAGVAGKAIDKIDVTSWADSIQESSSGRVVEVDLELSANGEVIGHMAERFAIRGRAFGDNPPADPPYAGGTDQEITDTPRSTLLRTKVTAPSDMTPFAWVSGDFNPIHTSHNAAKVAGLEAPLVHGMWLSATAQHAASAAGADGRRHNLTGWTYRMFGLVDLDAEIEITVERVGRLAGGGLVLEVACKIGSELVSIGTATTEAPTTAYVYPGQGIQSKGMGLNERTKSKAAADVWDRADKHTRQALGFSILTLVQDNPTVIKAQGKTYHHPDGVLNLTQFTQVALAALAFAQTARMREAGAVVDGAYFAGHSLGEYNALAAYAGVIDLETVLELVFHRGSTMHSLVPRGDDGRSNYRMGALRPNQFGVGDDGVREYVAEIAEKSGEFLEIVNYNLAGQQYSIAGTVAGLEALEEDANARAKAAGGKGAFMLVPGIDVPFHSSVLHAGVPDFREKLTELLPEDIDFKVLVGHYIPNLVAVPFELTREFLQAVLDVVPSEPVEKALKNFDKELENPRKLARMLLVELLCWQFASPVRWIETQEMLLAADKLAVDEVIEIGLGSAPTLANLAAKTLKLPEFTDVYVAVRNVQRDEQLVYHEDVQTIEDEPEEEAAEIPSAPGHVAAAEPAQPAPAPVPANEAAAAAGAPAAPPAAAPAPAGSVERPADLPFRASDAIRVLLAYANKVRPDQIGGADTTGTLTNGVSSRLNQLLMDFSAELGLASVEGAAEADVDTLSVTVDKAAHNYKAFGPVLGEAVKDRVRKLFGAAGEKQSAIADRVTGTWQLGDGWVDHVTGQILLGTREGASTRGGDLATMATEASSKADVAALIDEAVQQVGAAHGIPVAMPSAGGAGGGATVDSAVLDAFAENITGEAGVLTTTARHILQVLGHEETPAADFDHEEARETEALIEAVNAELGANWPKLVAPSFDENKAVLIDDRWATAREDLGRLWAGEDLADTVRFEGSGEAVANMADWWAAKAAAADKSKLAKRYEKIAKQARKDAEGKHLGEVAVVTGMAPGSIAGGVVAGLLAEGATVVATASRVSASRLAYAKQLYRENAIPGAALWLVPANLSSYRDVDALVEWIGGEQTQTVGSELRVLKPSLVPDMYFPFAAPPVMGSLEDAGAAAENQTRLLLWSVERSMAALAKIGADIDVDRKLHVVLPGSPNRGTFGGDGAYGEVKAAFDAIVNKWHVEPWAERITLAHPRIGWVAGTGLMGGNDPLVDAAKEAGIKVWTPDEIKGELLDLASAKARKKARKNPIDADLTGGLGEISIASLRADTEADSHNVDKQKDAAATVMALPSPVRSVQPTAQWGKVDTSLDDMIVMVSVGEVSPWGSGRTRFEAEYGLQSDGTVDLTAAGVLELAWMTGLLTWRDTPVAGWYDTDDNIVDEADIYNRYRDEVVARSGVRTFVDDAAIEDVSSPLGVEMFLDRDITFTVDDEAAAKSYVDADPTFTRAAEVDGEWQVTRVAGARARVPRKATLARKVGGQFPTDFDPTRWGIPASMVESIDRIAVWNLVTAVDAYLSAGFTPAEILQAVHPSDIAMTQGTGFGGMTSMRKLFLDRFLAEEIPSDILQETLPNVVAAHTMQAFIGGYGSMIHPIGACATAAVSVEEGVDKIACGKADFVVAGAIDDIAVESITGFANMNATADSDVMAGKGINERFYSRANDRRRAGFVEAQGGGTILLARGSVAAKLGLPVAAVVGFAQSYADGAHTSIPAPGLGALAAGRGGTESRLLKNLQKLGVSADDIAVVSKHDTSTNANDPNESELHTRLGRALGRTEGNPLFVVSQKTLTGHAKGGAAVFQAAGLADMFRTGRIPANKSLDCVDPAMASSPGLVWLRTPLQLPETIKAGLLTSLGFGHVSALLALVHPAAFHQAVKQELGDEAAAAWLDRAVGRLRAGVRRREAGMLGHAPLFTVVEGRNFGEDSESYDAHEVEAEMLLNPDARLGESGVFEGGWA
ncbi:type I polyketide synthase [Corynebacterium ulceribovis]|uniref:type I polyketide synthase n=1 Tax=Corynebacterium ulceribovis TaxID=487732 RepID=UPI000366FE0E|nr:type I polyketide synthase [Corynebacterium ulceribovis]